ncbi:50S ribosomal protein L11 methyltransferase [uncultured Alistipes sp.]|jgi:ribosomal protein L11 methyltransferase (prmA)|uniref:50S ribosomal protein L11 methyltransferase n=1 Tax=uncultured Alistipes sp. TaxID=538949 RepID=UPI0025FCE09A|nr:50S ribosomal protein L11 methyltransferase [uncultured Alistipes sp.]
MIYVALNIAFSDNMLAEILTAELADFPFESFETEANTLKAYIPQESLADCKSEIDSILQRYGAKGRYISIEQQNWNALWESNFPAVDVQGRLLIRAPFHAPAPEGVMEVVIMPKMSFGTGHHATTWLVSRAVLDLDVAGRTGLDMGSGTGVLSIVAVKCGAMHVDAVDIDEWADANCRENIAANGVADRITPMLGDVRLIAGRRYGFILANINRNILLADMPAYVAALDAGGDLVMSGFLEEDVPAIVGAAAALGLELVQTAARDGWMMVHVRKTGN